ncbi:MAG: glycosyltransferase [Deinococcus sp.]
MATVCAFVLTRDRKELLVECLGALLAQTHPVDLVVVYDNASSDGTQELLRAQGLLDEPRIAFHRGEQNTGGAGGYAEGVRLCVEAGRDWLWLMDDDAEPRPDALDRLLESPPAQDPRTVAVCTEVVHPDGTVDPLHRCRMGRFIVPLAEEAYRPGGYAEVGCASFVGLLVRTVVARQVGLPRSEFFIGYDDAEWSLRLRRHGQIRLVPESALVHKIQVGGGSATGRSRFWNRVLGQHYASSSWEGFWKDLYRLRNFMWTKHRYGRVGPLAFAGLTATSLVQSLMYDPRPLRRLPWLVRYAAKGRRGDFSSGLSPQDWARMAAR